MLVLSVALDLVWKSRRRSGAASPGVSTGS
jgi:hypothetical protein